MRASHQANGSWAREWIKLATPDSISGWRIHRQSLSNKDHNNEDAP